MPQKDITCEGCFWGQNDSTKMCGDCEIRNCARVRTIENCGVCPDYPCEIVERRIPVDCESRIRLDKIAGCR